MYIIIFEVTYIACPIFLPMITVFLGGTRVTYNDYKHIYFLSIKVTCLANCICAVKGGYTVEKAKQQL